MNKQETAAGSEVIPQFHVTACDCETDCQSIMFVMQHPELRPVKGSEEELVSVVHFPVENIQSLVDHLRFMAKRWGIAIK